MEKKETKSISKEEVQAPFNVAIATLMRIDDLLKTYSSIIPKNLDFDGDEIRHHRGIVIRDLIVQSAPLLKSEKTKELMEDFKKINKENEKFVELQLELDNLMIKVQQELQEAGKYLMPSAKDPRFNWGNP